MTELFVKRLKAELREAKINNKKREGRIFLLSPDPDNLLIWYGFIIGMDGDYTGGQYLVEFKLKETYPLDSPVVKFITPNGRFQCDVNICTTATHYHNNENNAAWNLMAQMQGIISMMPYFEPGIGGINASSEEKKCLAIESVSYNGLNLKNKKIIDTCFNQWLTME